MPDPIRKFLSGPATVLGDRQVRVRCSSAAVDRAGDIVVQSGIQFAASIPVLWSHDPEVPVGRAAPQLIANELFAVIDFAPPGVSAKADEICALTKAGVITGVSIGFDPIARQPIDPKNPYGGQKYLKSELLELSLVSVPANADAGVVGRSMKAGRALSGANREKLKRAHDLIDKGRGMVAGLLDETEPDADDAKAARIRRAKAIGLALPPPMTPQVSVPSRSFASKAERVAYAASLGSAGTAPCLELAPIYRAASELGITITEAHAKSILHDAKRVGHDPLSSARIRLSRLYA